MQNKNFTIALTGSLRKHYGGRIPSFSTIARDFALHSPVGLAPISVETPRKWLRGDSLPSLERLQTLAQWLGPELLDSLKIGQLKKPESHKCCHLQPSDQIVCVTELLEQLTKDELSKIEQLLIHLVNAHVTPRSKKS